MRQFDKLVAIEPVSLTEWGINEVKKFAKEITFYNDIPSDDEEIVRRIGDADAVLLSYTSRLTANAMKHCPSIKYVGMCCSLYSPESANVDIEYANNNGITVTFLVFPITYFLSTTSFFMVTESSFFDSIFP